MTQNNNPIATAEEILCYLSAIMRCDIQTEDSSVGNEIKPKRLPDEKERMKAAELLGKRYGLFTEIKEDEVVRPVIVDNIRKRSTKT